MFGGVVRISEALAHVQSLGLIVDELVTDGAVHRVPVTGKTSGTRSGAYCFSELVIPDVRTEVCGFVCNWYDRRFDFLKPDMVDDDPFESMYASLQIFTDMQAMQKQHEDEVRIEASHRAAEIFDKLPDRGKAPFLFNNHIGGYGLRYSKKTVVIPIKTIEDEWRGLQFIDEHGQSRFLTGTDYSGAFHLLGKVKKELAIVRDYASAAVIHKTMNWPVAVAFDDENLRAIGKVFRKKYPKISILICGSGNGATDNVETTLAALAAFDCQGECVYPFIGKTV